MRVPFACADPWCDAHARVVYLDAAPGTGPFAGRWEIRGPDDCLACGRQLEPVLSVREHEEEAMYAEDERV